MRSRVDIKTAKFFIVSSCEGTSWTYFVDGFDALKRKVVSEFIDEPFEEAMETEWVRDLVSSLCDFDGEWEHSCDGPFRWKTKEEQGYLEVIRITE